LIDIVFNNLTEAISNFRSPNFSLAIDRL